MVSILILGILLLTPGAYSQENLNTAKVCGTVVDQDDGEPLPGAIIYIVESDRYLATDQNGRFCAEPSPGTWNFTFSHLGRQTTEKRITVSAGEEKEILVQLKASTALMDEVQVLAKSDNREIRESPTVTVQITNEFLAHNRENSLMQTLEKIPGVSTINIGSGQSKPVIRGLGFNRVSVVQNGIKHEAQQWGHDHGLEIDQYGVENIQIIKGPASLLYGSDAIAGIVDIQPAAIPQPDSLSGEINMLGESNNELFGLSAGAQIRKGKWFYRGRVTYRDYADYKVPADQISYDSYIFQLHNNHLRNTAGREANASFSIGYISDQVRSETFFSNVYAKNGFFANAHGLEVRSSAIDYDRSNRDIDLPFHQVNHFKITNNNSINLGNHTLHLDLGYQNNQREEHSEPSPHGYMPKPSDSKEREFTKNTYSLNLKNSFTASQRYSAEAGINTEIQVNTIGGWGFLIPAYNRFTAGIFAYNQYEMFKDFFLQAGLRYDYGITDTRPYLDWYPTPVRNSDGTVSQTYLQRAQDKTLKFDNISASLGVSYIRNNTSFKINLGKSFRIPLANELASDGVNYHMYRYERGDLNLDAEESYQVDFEIDHSSEFFNFNISPFLNLFENYIYLNPTPNYYETLQVYEYTQSKVFRTGGEISAGATLFNRLTLNASGEYVYSRQTSGSKEGFTLPFSPPFSSVLSAGYRFEKLFFLNRPQLMADYKITVPQHKIVPPEKKTNGHQVLNVSFLADIHLFNGVGPIEMRLKINNLFDTKYFNHTSFYRLIDVPEAGRNISISLNIPFNN